MVARTFLEFSGIFPKGKGGEGGRLCVYVCMYFVSMYVCIFVCMYVSMGGWVGVYMMIWLYSSSSIHSKVCNGLWYLLHPPFLYLIFK